MCPVNRGERALGDLEHMLGYVPGIMLLIPESSSGSQIQQGLRSPEPVQDSTFTSCHQRIPRAISVVFAVCFDQPASSVPSSVQAFLWRFVWSPPPPHGEVL